MSKQGTILNCGSGEGSRYWLSDHTILLNRVVIINDRVYKWWSTNPYDADWTAEWHESPEPKGVVMLRTELLEEDDPKAVQARKQQQHGIEFEIDNSPKGTKIGLTPRRIHQLLGGHPPPRWLRLFTLECMLDAELDAEPAAGDSEVPDLWPYFEGDVHRDHFRFQHRLTVAAESEQGLPLDDFDDSDDPDAPLDVSVRDPASAALSLLEHAGQSVVEVKDLAHLYNNRDTSRHKEYKNLRAPDGTALRAARARLALRHQNENEAETLSCGTSWARDHLRSIADTAGEQGWTSQEVSSAIRSAARTSAIDVLSDQDLSIALQESFAQAAHGQANRLHVDVFSSYLSRRTVQTLEVIGGMALTTAISYAELYPSTVSRCNQNSKKS